MTTKIETTVPRNNGHEMAPLNTRARGDGTHGVTIVLSEPARSSIASGGDDDPDRAAWSGKMQFFLSIIGYSVGLGILYLCGNDFFQSVAYLHLIQAIFGAFPTCVNKTEEVCYVK